MELYLQSLFEHLCTEPEFVTFLEAHESIPSLAGRYDNPIWRTRPPGLIG